MGVAQGARSDSPTAQGAERVAGAEADVEQHSLAGRKRAAVELIRNSDAALRSSARRFSICQDDAEDAYQRGIEILLSKAPTTDTRQLLPWARTVIKHEALAIRKARERVMGRPAAADWIEESEDWIHLIPCQGSGPEERVERRELVDRSREALATLKPHELKALTQLAEGYSYAEIAALNGWTRTKVNRCLAEGRARFRAVFSQSEAGERCAGLEPLLSACCDGELKAEELAEVRNHLAACGYCRATLRSYRAAPRAAAALLPAAPGAPSVWERLQELAVSVQLRFQATGRGSDQALGAVAASGGARGAGVATLAKIASVCVGTAGGAAACVAVGVLPAPGLSPLPEKRPAIERPAASTQTPSTARTEPAAAPVGDPASGKGRKPAPAGEVKSESQQARSAPTPTPVEQEFTPEAAGMPVSASAAPPPPDPSPPPSSPSVSTSSPAAKAPVGGGGEFGP